MGNFTPDLGEDFLGWLFKLAIVGIVAIFLGVLFIILQVSNHLVWVK